MKKSILLFITFLIYIGSFAQKISDFPTVTTTSPNSWVPIVDNATGKNRKISVANLGYNLDSLDRVDSIWRTVGIDSIYFTVNGIQYAILDSAGGGGFDSTHCWTNLYIDTITGCSDIVLSGDVKVVEGSDLELLDGHLKLTETNASHNKLLAVGGDTSVITYAGNMGLGTGTPTAKLTVKGTGTGTDTAFAVKNSSGVNNFYIQDNGKVIAGNSVGSLGLGVNTGYNSTLTNSTFIGSGAGFNITSGNSNTSIGSNSLSAITSGSANTAVGDKALTAHSTQSNNVAIGANAMLSDQSGYENVAVGTDALRTQTGGYENTAIGQYSLYYNTGFKNTSIGRSALVNNSSGAWNVGIGHTAGSINSTGTYNTYIGYTANATHNNLTNSTAIGANSFVSQSNSMVLGDTSNVNVGIGTTVTDAKLKVVNTNTAQPVFKAVGTKTLTVEHGTGYVNGAYLPHAQLTNTTTITFSSTTEAKAIKFTTLDDTMGIYVVNDTLIYVRRAGDYEFIPSILYQSVAGGHHLDIWFNYNGADIPRSNTIVETSSASRDAVLAIGITVEMAAGSYVKLMSHTDNTGLTLPYTAAQANPTRPESPSVILNIKKISE